MQKTASQCAYIIIIANTNIQLRLSIFDFGILSDLYVLMIQTKLFKMDSFFYDFLKIKIHFSLD